jgi:hypothetical protein
MNVYSGSAIPAFRRHVTIYMSLYILFSGILIYDSLRYTHHYIYEFIYVLFSGILIYDSLRYTHAFRK